MYTYVCLHIDAKTFRGGERCDCTNCSLPGISQVLEIDHSSHAKAVV